MTLTTFMKVSSMNFPLPIELVSKVFTYTSSPTAKLIKESKFYNDICTCRYLQGGLDGETIDYNPNQLFIEHDYHVIYTSYTIFEDVYELFWQSCDERKKPIGFDKEGCYAYLYEYMFKREGRALLPIPQLYRDKYFRHMADDMTWVFEQMGRFVEEYGPKPKN